MQVLYLKYLRLNLFKPVNTLFRISMFITKKLHTGLHHSGTKLQSPNFGIPHKISYTRSSQQGSKFTTEPSVCSTRLDVVPLH